MNNINNFYIKYKIYIFIFIIIIIIAIVSTSLYFVFTANKTSTCTNKCADGKCCPTGTTCCNGKCCSTGTTCCNGNCCDNNTQTCQGTGTQATCVCTNKCADGKCCPTGTTCCYGNCCSTGTTCKDDQKKCMVVCGEEFCDPGQICYDSNGRKVCAYGWKPDDSGNPYCVPVTDSASGIKYFTEKACMQSSDMYTCPDGIDEENVQGALIYCGNNQKCYDPVNKCENSVWPYSIKLDNDLFEFGSSTWNNENFVGDNWQHYQQVKSGDKTVLTAAKCPKNSIYLAASNSNVKYCVSDNSKIPLTKDQYLPYNLWN